MNWSPDEHYQSRKVASEYDRKRFASVPGRVFNHLEKRTIVKCFARVPKGQTIADAPCGTGRLAEPLLAAGYRVHGLDISDEMLEIARQRLRGFPGRFACEVVDVKASRPHEPLYDAALCARVLMHFPLDQQVEFLTGVAMLSRSIVVINHSLDSGYQRFRRRVKHWLGNQASANYPVSNADIRVLLQQSGLREVQRYRLASLVSEAIYIVAERITPAAESARARPSQSAAAVS
jgi:2-polyprenyl-3-methyl-5-hydroxy-6-metoxy-1,4-benzoquinol methylase